MTQERKQKNQKGEPAPREVRLAITKIVQADGEQAAIDKLGLSRQTVSRLVGGLNVNRASLEMAMGRLGLARP